MIIYCFYIPNLTFHVENFFNIVKWHDLSGGLILILKTFRAKIRYFYKLIYKPSALFKIEKNTLHIKCPSE